MATDDLKALFPGRSVQIGGEAIKVSPFGLGQLPVATRLAADVFRVVADKGVLSVGVQDGEFHADLAPDWIGRLPEVIAEAGESLMKLVAFAIKKDRDWLDEVPPDLGIELVQAVFEENATFFMQKVLPRLGFMMKNQAAPETLPDGAPSSSDLSAPATGSATSSTTP